MTRQVNIYDAKTRLSQLIQQLSDGEEIVIAKAGKPVAKLVAYQESVPDREPGQWRGQVRISPDFDVLPPELEAAFRGGSD